MELVKGLNRSNPWTSTKGKREVFIAYDKHVGINQLWCEIFLIKYIGWFP